MKKCGEPISPHKFSEATPDWVFDIINEKLLKNYDSVSKTTIIYAVDVWKEIKERCKNPDEKWLNFEEGYRSKGWTVTYDDSCHENCEPCWIFSII